MSNEHFIALRESVKDEFRFAREATHEYLHERLYELETKVVSFIDHAEGKVVAAEAQAHRRFDAIESRMHVAETRLDAHAEAIAPGGHDGHSPAAAMHADEESLKHRLAAVEQRIQLIEDRLTTHVDTRLAKVERDASTNRVDTGVAPPYSNAQSQRVEQGR